jgi:hypothetical protein
LLSLQVKIIIFIIPLSSLGGFVLGKANCSHGRLEDSGERRIREERYARRKETILPSSEEHNDVVDCREY